MGLGVDGIIGQVRLANKACMLWVGVVLLIGLSVGFAGAVEFLGPRPGKARAVANNGVIRLENNILLSEWVIDGGRLKLVQIRDKISGEGFVGDKSCFFKVVTSEVEEITSEEFSVAGECEVEAIEADSEAVRRCERFKGRRLSVKLRFDKDSQPEVVWRAELRDGSNYVRQFISVKGGEEAVGIEDFVVLEFPCSEGEVIGSVRGSVVRAGNMFFGCEHPLASNRVVTEGVKDARIVCELGHSVKAEKGEPITASCVIGVTGEGQFRRGFLYYLEREKAHPYRGFLHYNSWYDIAWHGRKMKEEDCLRVIDLFGEELVEKRGVKVDCFVFDDGWDDNRSLWRFNNGFPNGFSKIEEKAKRYGSQVGVWLSPWGGYGEAKQERLKYGRCERFEIDEKGFCLSGERYYERFREVCREMIEKYDVGYFKFDGISAVKGEGAGSEYWNDVDALLRLIGELGGMQEGLFVNVTVGTWPSPFWLMWADSIWRGGRDVGTCGWGTSRQQWITYRDKEVYKLTVQRGPLYPLNSLMIHGLAFARHGYAKGLSGGHKGIVDEIRTLFGSGTNLQELYVTGEMMRGEEWDALAEAVKWSRANADVLVDTHWVGGNPGEGEVYGWASWSKGKGILTLRNPYETKRSIEIDIGEVFELPEGACEKYRLKHVFGEDEAISGKVLVSGDKERFEPGPFEVLVFEALRVNQQ